MLLGQYGDVWLDQGVIMRCEDIMKRDVKCLGPHDTVQSAARAMRQENVGFLPVCDASMKALGTITDRDLTIRVLADGRAADTRIQDVMTKEVVSCRANEELSRAEDLMAQNRKSRCMCTDDSGKLIGVISLADLAKRGDEARAAETMRGVSEREART